jgi:hypothetical protein
MTGGLPPISSFFLATSPLRLMTSIFFFQLNSSFHSPYVTSSLMRGWVCHLQLLLALARAIILRFKFHRTHDHILLSQIRDSPKLQDQAPILMSPRNRVVQLHPQALGSFFVASYDSQGCSGGIRPSLHAGSSPSDFRVRVRVRVRVTLLLAVYRQSVRPGHEPLETHDQQLFFN